MNIRKQRGKLVAALLTLHGNKQRCSPLAIADAVIVANAYLFNGYSAATAADKGYKVLHKSGRHENH